MKIFLIIISLFFYSTINAQRLVPASEGATTGKINALLVHNDILYIGGRMDSIMGQAKQNLVMWDGGSELTQINPSNGDQISEVKDLITLNDEVYVSFRNSTNFSWNVGKIENSELTILGGNFNNVNSFQPFDLEVYSSELYVAGRSYFVDGYTYISKWTGAEWTPVGDGIESKIITMEVYNDELYIMLIRLFPQGNSI